MRNKNIKPLFNLLSDLTQAVINKDKAQVSSLLEQQNTLIAALKPRDYYTYTATLAAATIDTSFTELDKDISKICKSDLIAVKTKFLKEMMRDVDKSMQKLDDPDAHLAYIRDKIKPLPPITHGPHQTVQ